MKAAIVGSRTFDDYNALVEFIDETIDKYNLEDVDLVVSGAAKGADALGAKFAKDNGIDLLEFPAEWKKYGKSAGFRRNVTIIENCDICFAFWDGESHGTQHDLQLCKEMNKPCYVYNFITKECYKYN